MKKLTLLLFIGINSLLFAQKLNYQTVFSIDSLQGFNEATAKATAVVSNFFGEEYKFFMSKQKRSYIISKYNLPTNTGPNFNNYKPIGGNNQIMAGCTNIDFEAGSLAGWTQTNGLNSNSTTYAGCCPTAGGNAIVVSGGTDALTGVSLNSPFGGSWVAKINNTTTGTYTDRLSQNFNVTSANALVQFAYLAVLQSAGHSCNQQPYMNIRLIDCSGNVIPCPQVDIQEGAGCGSALGFVAGSGFSYSSNWQVGALDLTPYIGTCVTLEVTAGACTASGHWGYGYFDAKCSPMDITVNNVSFPLGIGASTVALCSALSGTVTAPPGLGPYNWNGPAGSGVTNSPNQTFTTTTPGQYTLTMNPIGGCAPIIRIVNLQITTNPLANFTINYVPCSTSSLTATSTSSLNGGTMLTGFQYNWGDATANSTVNPATHNYASSGPKVISFTVTNASGCTSIISQNVNISQKPIVNFTFTPLCMGAPINFTNNSTTASGTNSYTWDYGNALGSNATNPSVNYLNSGTYTVTLIATNTDLCTDSIKKTVTVYGRPLINFTPTSICYNTATTFSNLTTTTVNANTGTIATYSWNFGATAGSSGATNPVYTYTNPSNATANITYSVDLYTTTSNGCVDVLTKTVTVYSLPTPTFVADSVCITNVTTLTNVGSNNGNPYYLFNWDFNNDNIADASSISPTATYVFPTPGNTNVTYTVITSPNGGALQCKSVFNKNIWVHAGPQAIITNTNQCVGSTPVGLSGVTSTLAIGTLTNYAWNYGNATSSLVNATPSTSVVYNPSGNYVVTLTVTSMAGCSSIATKTVNVYGRAVINFNPNAICFNTPTTFTNLTSTTVNANTGAVASWSWNFGATAGSSTLQNPITTYTNPANATANTTYSATLFATTANGCKDSLTKIVTVYSLPTPNFVSDSVCLGNQTTLAYTGNNNGNPLTFFLWDFNNDGLPDVTNTSLSTQTIFPNYGNNPVTYTVVTSPNSGLLSCWDKITKNVWVHPIPVAAFTHINQCLDTQPVNITAANSNIAIGSITNYAWNYGNNNSNLINPTPATSYSYNLAGNYVVTLTVTSNAGCKNTTTNLVEVWERPYGHFSYTKTCLTKRTVLKGFQQAVGSGSITAYDWDFNNNTSTIEASGAQVNYTFATAGTQTVNMLLTTDKGCKNTIPGTIYINYIPKPNFVAPKRAGCADLCITILDSSATLTGPAKNDVWEWTFGNGETSTANSPISSSHCYTNTSNFTVQNYSLRLILRSDSGCVDSIIKKNYVTVYPNPIASFEWEGVEGNILIPTVQFTNTSQGYSAFQWYYNDGTNAIDSINHNPSHYYNTDSPKSYNVFLAVRNQYGCKDTTTRLIEIGPSYTFYIPNAFTPNEDGVNDIFTGKGIGIKTYKMWIYDRWGEMISYTEDIIKGWNGTVKGNHIDTKSDVYQYRVLVTDLSNKLHEYVGHVSLIK